MKFVPERDAGVLGVNVGAEDEGGDGRGGARPQRQREPQHVHHQDIPLQVQEGKKSVFPKKKEQVAYCPFFLLQAQGQVHLQLLHPVGPLCRRVVDVLPHPSAHHRRVDVAPRHPLPLPNQHLPGHCEVGKRMVGR